MAGSAGPETDKDNEEYFIAEMKTQNAPNGRPKIEDIGISGNSSRRNSPIYHRSAEKDQRCYAKKVDDPYKRAKKQAMRKTGAVWKKISIGQPDRSRWAPARVRPGNCIEVRAKH